MDLIYRPLEQILPCLFLLLSAIHGIRSFFRPRRILSFGSAIYLQKCCNKTKCPYLFSNRHPNKRLYNPVLSLEFEIDSVLFQAYTFLRDNSQHAVSLPKQFVSMKRFNLGMLDNTVACIELHWLVDSLVRSIHCSILEQGRLESVQVE